MMTERTNRMISRILYSVTAFAVLACGGGKTTEGPVETPIGNTHFTISLPAGYSLNSQKGPDFVVYFFAPSDTTNTKAYSGGMYFGNFPQLFGPPHPMCETAVKKNQILGNTSDWTVFSCDSIYSAQTIIMSNSKEDWNKQIHAFGKAPNEEDLGKLISVFSTLKQD
jgi:hypothetical protein